MCISGCPEGAIELIDGKACLVNASHCDGLGACVGVCPYGAIETVEKESAAYNEQAVLESIIPQGKESVSQHLRHLKEHQQYEYLRDAKKYLDQHGLSDYYSSADNVHSACPFSSPERSSGMKSDIGKNLQPWPIQLQLVNPDALFFENAKIVIAADCVAYRYRDFQSAVSWGSVVLIFCPKLDHANELYQEKLVSIFKAHTILSVTVFRMEVPCCSALSKLVFQAQKTSGKDFLIQEQVISIAGEKL